MTYGNLKRLTGSDQQISSTEGTIYSSPTGKTSELVTFLLHNTHNSNVDIDVWFPASIGSDSNKRMAISIEPNETFEFSPKVPVVLFGAEQIRMEASVDNVISVFIIGREEI